MLSRAFHSGVWVSLALAALAHAHIAAFHRAMYCFNGTDPNANPINNNEPVQPLYMLPYEEYWMHHSNLCDEYPPDEGDFLELTAGGIFEVELAGNRAVTSFNPGAVLTNWGDGKEHPDNYTGNPCIFSPNLHTQNQSMAAGSAWAISHESDIKKVTMENLVVFSVAANTPWQRVTRYEVPSGMPACPEEGCICTWVWIPNHCGKSNIYMFPYKCKVIPDSTPPKTIGKPQPPVWCEEDESLCVKGPKQILIWHQLEGNNIEVTGYDKSGEPKSPGYNMKCGFEDGAQNSMFVDPSELDASNSTTASSLPAGSATPTGSGSLTASGTPTPSGLPASASAPAGSVPPTPAPSGPPGNSSVPSGSAPPPPPSGQPGSSSAPSGSAPPPPPSGQPGNSSAPSGSAPPSGPNPSSVSGTPTVPPTSPMSTGPAVPTDPNLPSGSGTPTGSYTHTDTCSPTAGARRAVHAKRMARERRDIF